MRRRATLTLRALAAAFVACATLAHAATAAYASASILGGGSGFAALEIDQWRADTARSPFNLTVNYVAQGSSFGRAQFAAGTFDYGASDIQYVEGEIPTLTGNGGRCHGKSLSACFVYVPVSAGGVSFMYNLLDANGNRVSNLKLTENAVCKIFTGQITKWNDPAIVATNPSFANFNRDITPVIRADGAGESYVFSEFCIADAPSVWRAFITSEKASAGADSLSGEFLSGQPTSIWPQQWGHSVPIAYADGTANYVADPGGGANSITYVAASYAEVRQFPVASVQNAAGVFTQPDEDNVTTALGYATPRGNGTFQLAYSGPDPHAYFPSTYSYVLAQTTGFDRSKGAALGQFLCYAVSEGQVDAVPLRYARLSTPLVNIAINAIAQIPGAPSKQNCFVQGAPPPPAPPKVLGGGSGFVTGPGGVPLAGAGGSNSGTSSSAGSGSNASLGSAAGSSAGKNAGKIAAARAARVAAGLAGGGYVTTTTVDQQALNDAELARAAQLHQPGSGGTPTVWILLAGLAAAWAASVLLSRKRSAS